MLQEDKELLLKDLCARLPYGVTCACGKYDGQLKLVCPDGDYCILQNSPYAIETIKPYLRPMSSMTEDEAKEYHTIDTGFIRGDMTAKIDFYLKHHFDFRLTHEGLSMIEAGLALEAPEGMYTI